MHTYKLVGFLFVLVLWMLYTAMATFVVVPMMISAGELFWEGRDFTGVILFLLTMVGITAVV